MIAWNPQRHLGLSLQRGTPNGSSFKDGMGSKEKRNVARQTVYARGDPSMLLYRAEMVAYGLGPCIVVYEDMMEMYH